VDTADSPVRLRRLSEGKAVVLVPAAIDVLVAIEDLFIEAFVGAADVVVS
jgi:hypothetical protein